ncbi:MAG: hypothetical protein KDI79_06965 [Anaerolineae bacterium]|nr:hypothetical protein [Anaerolineae bacterium]
MSVFNQEGQTVHGDQYNAANDMNIEKGDTFSGDFRGAVLNVRSTLTNVTQSIGAIPYASDEDKQTLKDLIIRLNEALEEAANQDPGISEETEAVAETAKDLVEKANKEKPNRKSLEITGDGLVKAAENVAKVTPLVLTISKQIVAFILGTIMAT